ncbi:hypothetical protein BU17DRAFT_70632 [Hysterangium stoloniferum]|nr:hypothetical protein BU17DRAFT_70632 [Hysterangium stoloniferum]
MTMDPAPLLRELVITFPQDPAVGVAVGLMIEMIVIVGGAKNNIGGFNYLVYETATRLVAIIKYMHGRWDDAPVIRACLGDFEVFLQRFLNVVKQYQRSSTFATIFRYRSCQRDIDKLSRQLKDIERSTVKQLFKFSYKLAINMHSTTAVNIFCAAVDSQNLAYTKLLAEMRILILRAENTIPVELAGKDLLYFTRQEFELTRLICPDHAPLPQHAPDYLGLLVRLFEARHKNGQVMLIKVYEGRGKNQSNQRQKAFHKTLHYNKTIWNHVLLQIIGSSSWLDTIPFHDWLCRTWESRPAETIEGLYCMKESYKELIDFQKQQNVRCIVDVRRQGGELKWSLIYSGELIDGEPYVSDAALGYSQIDIVSDFQPQKGIEISRRSGHRYLATNGWGLVEHSPVFPYKPRPIDAPCLEYKEWGSPELPEPEIVTFEGKPIYKRYTLPQPPVTASRDWMNCYTWISPREIWKFWSHFAPKFIKENNLSLSPHDLQLVTLADAECAYALYLETDQCQSAMSSLCGMRIIYSRHRRSTVTIAYHPRYMYLNPLTNAGEKTQLRLYYSYLVEYYQLPQGTWTKQ